MLDPRIVVKTNFKGYCANCNVDTSHRATKIEHSPIVYTCVECDGVRDPRLPTSEPVSIWDVEGQERRELEKRVEGIKDRLNHLSQCELFNLGIVNQIEKIITDYEKEFIEEFGVGTYNNL